VTGKGLRLGHRGTVFNHEIDVCDAACVEIYLPLRRVLGDTCGYERFIERTGGQILHIQQWLGWRAQDSVSAAIEMGI
jgi:hypothetical protein